MFCPSCGAEYSIELKYCNRCGANLGGTSPAPQSVAPIDVTKSVVAIGTTMVVLTIGGFYRTDSGCDGICEQGHGGY